MRLSLLLGGICHTNGGAAWTSLTDLSRQRDDVICEDGEANLRCSGRDDVIKITEAVWGRENADQCAALDALRMENINCRADHVEKIAKLCKNQSNCKVPVNSDVLGDPCPGTRKYFKVSYECVKFAFGPTKPNFTFGQQKRLRPPVNSLLTGKWAIDPLRSTESVYQMGNGKLNIYDQNGDNLDLVDSVEVQTKSPDSIVVWGGEVYYVDNTRLIKYSVDHDKEISINLDKLAPDYVAGLFKANFRLLTSEFGVHGVYKSKQNGNWVVMTITGENDVINGRNSVDTQLKAHFDDDILMIGRSFYIIQNGQFKSAVDLLNQSQVAKRATNQSLPSGNYSQIAYVARHNQLLTIGIDGLDLISLTFLDHPLALPSTSTTTTSSTSSTVKTTKTVNSEITTNSNDGSPCPADIHEGMTWNSTGADTWMRLNCPSGTGTTERYCNSRGAWERPDTSQCAIKSEYAEFPEPIRSALESMRLEETLKQLTTQLASEETNAKRVELVERVSSILMTFESSYEMDHRAKKALLTLMDELHCWSLIESESFLWLVSQSGLESVTPTNHSLHVRPSRCSRDTLYIFNRGGYNKPLETVTTSGSTCYYFVTDESSTRNSNWAKCESCLKCDDNFFFKVIEPKMVPKFEFNILTISIVISLSIMTLLGAVLLVSRERELPYPGTLRFMLLGNQILLFSAILIPWSFARDAILTLSAMIHFQIILCISHCLYQKSKPVTTELDVKTKRYMCLILCSSLIILVTIGSIFFVLNPHDQSWLQASSIGWLSMSVTWSASLLTPILCAALFSSIWLILGASMSPQMRPLAVKFALYLLMLTITLTTLLLSLITTSSTVEMVLTVFILMSSFMTLATLSPDCALQTTGAKSGSIRTARANQSGGGWYHVTDNRSSLTDFRYIPVVHNIHSTSYVKPRTMDRLYTEIIPGEQLNQSNPISQMTPPSVVTNHRPFNTAPNQIACNLSTVDWGTNAVGTDSGVHTAQNSSDSSSSDRGSPIMARLDEKTSLLKEKDSPDNVENKSNTVDC